MKSNPTPELSELRAEIERLNKAPTFTSLAWDWRSKANALLAIADRLERQRDEAVKALRYITKFSSDEADAVVAERALERIAAMEKA